MNPLQLERALLAFVALAALVTFVTLPERWKAERDFQSVDLVADAAALVGWKDQLGLEPDEFVTLLQGYGISSVALAERSVDDLVEAGQLSVFSEAEFDRLLRGGLIVDPKSEQFRDLSLANLARWTDGKAGSYLLFHDVATAQAARFTLDAVGAPPYEADLQGQLLWVPLGPRSLRQVGFGFDPKAAQEWTELGFGLWLRAENRPGLTESQVSALYRTWAELPRVRGVIFAGMLNEAVGYPNALEESAASIQELGWRVGYIELPPRAQQDGIESLVRAAPEAAVRVFAVSPAHQAKLSPFRLIGMYSLAARERNLSVLYLRPYAVPGRPELDEEFFEGLKAELASVGEPSSFPELAPPSGFATALSALALGCCALLCWLKLGWRRSAPLFVMFLLAPLGAIGLLEALGRGVLARSLLALGLSLGLPALAALQWAPSLLDNRRDNRRDNPRDRSSSPNEPRLVDGLKLLFCLSAVSLLAGLWVAALLSDTTFLLGLDRFRGVKLLTLGGPVLWAALVFLKRISWEDLLAGLRRSVLLYQVLLAVGLAGALFFLYLRTGNEAGAAASETERLVRVLLDQFLGVRPRFKEFLVAHPAMILVPLVAVYLRYGAALLVFLIGLIGQAGIVDTFAHIHTPLLVTIIRVLLGVGLGALWGAACWLLVCRLERAWRAYSSKPAGDHSD